MSLFIDKNKFQLQHVVVWVCAREIRTVYFSLPTLHIKTCFNAGKENCETESEGSLNFNVFSKYIAPPYHRLLVHHYVFVHLSASCLPISPIFYFRLLFVLPTFYSSAYSGLIIFKFLSHLQISLVYRVRFLRLAKRLSERKEEETNRVQNLAQDIFPFTAEDGGVQVLWFFSFQSFQHPFIFPFGSSFVSCYNVSPIFFNSSMSSWRVSLSFTKTNGNNWCDATIYVPFRINDFRKGPNPSLPSPPAMGQTEGWATASLKEFV